MCIKCGRFLGFSSPGELVTATCEECMPSTPKECRDFLVNKASNMRSGATQKLSPADAPFKAVRRAAAGNLLVAGAAFVGFVAGAACFYGFIYAPYQRKNAALSAYEASEIALLREGCGSSSRFANAQYVVKSIENLEAQRRNTFIVHRVAFLYKPARIPSLEEVAESAGECNARIAPRIAELERRLSKLTPGQ